MGVTARGYKQIAFLSCLLVIVSSLGCVDGGGSVDGKKVYGDGVEMTSFSVQPSRVLSGDTAVITVVVQNLGTFTTRDNAYLYVYGLRDEWELSNVEGGEPAGGNEWYRNLGTLRAPVVSEGKIKSPGDVVEVTYFVDTPDDLSRGEVVAPRVWATLCYGYSTVARKDVKLISKEEAGAQVRETGDLELFSRDLDVSHGPLRISIETTDPIVVKGSRTVPIKITIRNVGDGVILSPEYSCSSLPSMDTETMNSMVNIIPADHVHVSLEGGSCTLEAGDEVFFLEGREATIYATCEATLSDPTEVRNFQVGIDYNYMITKYADVILESSTY